MKKLFFLLGLLLSITFMSAQTITVEKTYCLFSQKGFYPKLSSDGSLLAFTSSSYEGLSVYNFTDETIQKVSDDQGAGYDPIFSNDNKNVFFKNLTYESKLRNEGIKSYDITTKTQKEMLHPRRNMRQPQAFQNGFMVFADSKIFKSTFGKTEAKISNYVWSDGNNLNIYKNDKTHILNPIEGANGYIWASLSPNAKMIVFTAAGKGTYVCDLNGKILADLGYLNAPAWHGNDFVVGMQDKDDGHFVTESKVLIKSIDGKMEKILSENNQIAMYPSSASSVDKVAYNTISGDIYIVELGIDK